MIGPIYWRPAFAAASILRRRGAVHDGDFKRDKQLNRDADFRFPRLERQPPEPIFFWAVIASRGCLKPSRLAMT
jgi:hypothetical protein